MEEILWETIDNLLKKLIQKKAMSGISKEIGDLFDNCSQEYLSAKIRKTISESVSNASWAGLTSCIPGVGPTINVVATAGITCGMYADINSILGISFSDNFLKSVSSGICAKLASTIAVAGVSCIPGIGSVVAACGGIITNRVALYSSAYVYIQALTAMIDKGEISENAFDYSNCLNNNNSDCCYQVGIVGHHNHGKTTLYSLTQNWILDGVESNVVYCDFESFYDAQKAMSDIDGIILVVDACEGPMPQTRELLINALQNNVSIIAVYLSKCSICEDESEELVEMEISSMLEDFGVYNIPILYGDTLEAETGFNHDCSNQWTAAYLNLLRIVNNWEMDMY